MQKDLMRIRFT